MARQANITMPRWLKPQMATSMQRRTGTPTKTPAAVGRAQVRTRIRNTTRQAIRAPQGALQLPAATGSRKKVGLQPSAVAVVAAGKPGRLVLAARPAPAVGAAGQGGGKRGGPPPGT